MARPEVDIATGEVAESVIDFRRDGLLPLTVGRQYSSFRRRAKLYIPAWGSDDTAPFGAGWCADWDHVLRQTVHGFVYVRPDGEEIDLRVRALRRTVHTGHRIEVEPIDSHRVRVVDYACGRAPVSRVFAMIGNDGRWLLQSIEYRRSNRIDLLRDDRGRVTRLEHTRSRSALAVGYRNERVVRIDLMTPDGGQHFVAGYGYDAQGLLVETHDRIGVAMVYAYHANGALVRIEKRGGAVFGVAYDRSGRCTRLAGIDDYHLREFIYDTAGRRTVMSNAYGERWTYDLDAGGRVIGAISPLGRATSFEFDAAGRLRWAADTAKRMTSYEYDDLGRLVARESPVDSRFWLYDEQHRIIGRNGPLEEFFADYNDDHDLISVERGDARWELTYNVHGEQTSLRTPLGSTRTYLYDELGNLTGESDFRGNFTGYEYDAFGRCTKITTPLGDVEERSTDELDRVVSSTRTGGAAARFEYTEGTRVAVGLTGARETLRHDRYGRALEHVDSEGLIGRLHWGREPDQLLSIVNAIGDRESFYYDADDRIVEVRTLDGRVLRVDYSDAGLASIDASREVPPSSQHAGARTTVELDDLGRLIRVSSGNEEKVFEYDEDGFLTRAESNDSVVELVHDAHGRCVGEVHYDATSTKAAELALLRDFDALGRAVRIACTNLPEVAIAWDENARVSSVQMEGTAVRYTRDANGAEIERIANGARLSTKRDLEGRETECTHETAGKDMMRIGASYDSRGLLSFLSVTATDVHESLMVRYDGRKRLRALVRRGEGLSSAFFAYDGEGHWVLHARTARGEEVLRILEGTGWDRTVVVAEHHADETATAIVQAGGRLEALRLGGVTVRYRWDARGRVVEKVVVASETEDTWRFEYDAWDALRRVESPRGVVFAYRYDAFGRCIARTSTEGSNLRFIWDGELLLHVLTDEGALLETRLCDAESDEWLLQRFGDGRVDIRSNAFRVLEDLLGGGASVAPPSWGPSPARAYCDEESLVSVGIGRYFDMETGYHLTWQRGEQLVPVPGSRPDTAEEVLLHGMMGAPASEPSAFHAFISPTGRSILDR